jgi:hypothetical protein
LRNQVIKVNYGVRSVKLIKLVYEDYRTKFVFVCDYCHKEITDPHMAMYAWRAKRGSNVPSDGIFYTLHKGVCDYATTEMDTNHAKSIYTWKWMELVDLPGELIKDMGLTWEQAQGQLSEYKEKDSVKIQLMQKELDEWKRSSYPSHSKNEDLGEGGDEE